MTRTLYITLFAALMGLTCETPPAPAELEDQAGVEALKEEVVELRAELEALKAGRGQLESRIAALEASAEENSEAKPGETPAGADEVEGETGLLTVNTKPQAQVYIDGERVAEETPLSRHPIEVGSHTVRVFYHDSRRFSETKRAMISQGRHVSLFFKERAETVVTTDEDAQLYVDGRLKAVGRELTLRRRGSVQALWLSDGALSEAREVDTSAKSLRITRSDGVAEATSGRVEVEAEAGAAIRVDGVEVGVAPLVDYPLRAGSYAVWASGPTGRSLPERVDVKAGETSTITLELSVRRAPRRVRPTRKRPRRP